MRKLKDPEVIIAILLIIFFFLPWITINGIFPAYKIPFALEDIVTFADWDEDDEDNLKAN